MVLARDVALTIPFYDSRAYSIIWAWTLPLLLAAQAFAGWETLKTVARLYPKIGNFAVRLFLVCLAATTVACCVGLPFEVHRIGGEEAVLRALFLLQRWMDSWIAGTLALVSFFLAGFPAPLKQPPRNLVMHTILLMFYFGGYGALFFAENLAPLGAIVLIERLQFILVVFLYAIWAIFLSKSGENSQPWPEIEILVLRTVTQDSQ